MAISFNGTSSSISVTPETAFDFERTQAFSIAAWIYPTITRTNNSSVHGHAIFSKLATSGNFRGFEFDIAWKGSSYGSNNNITAMMFYLVSTLTTNNIRALSATDIPNNTWSHVACTYDGSSDVSGVALYLNGTAQTKEHTFNNLSATTLNDLTPRIGSRQAAQEFHNGGLAELGVWNVALTAAEVAGLAKGQPAHKVRPASLLHCPPLVREIVDPKGLTMSATATSVTDHPRVYR